MSIVSLGSLRIYDLQTKEIILQTKFSSGGSFLTWCPLTWDSAGMSVIAGFCDGVLRILRIDTDDDGTCKLALVHVSKPHSEAITALSVNGNGRLLASGVSLLFECVLLF